MFFDSPEYAKAVEAVFGPFIQKRAQALAEPLALAQELAKARVLDQLRQTLLQILTIRFGPLSTDLLGRIETVSDLGLLQDLILVSAVCNDLVAFEAELIKIASEVPPSPSSGSTDG